MGFSCHKNLITLKEHFALWFDICLFFNFQYESFQFMMFVYILVSVVTKIALCECLELEARTSLSMFPISLDSFKYGPSRSSLTLFRYSLLRNTLFPRFVSVSSPRAMLLVRHNFGMFFGVF